MPPQSHTLHAVYMAQRGQVQGELDLNNDQIDFSTDFSFPPSSSLTTTTPTSQTLPLSPSRADVPVAEVVDYTTYLTTKIDAKKGLVISSKIISPSYLICVLSILSLLTHNTKEYVIKPKDTVAGGAIAGQTGHNMGGNGVNWGQNNGNVGGGSNSSQRGQNPSQTEGIITSTGMYTHNPSSPTPSTSLAQNSTHIGQNQVGNGQHPTNITQSGVGSVSLGFDGRPRAKEITIAQKLIQTGLLPILTDLFHFFVTPTSHPTITMFLCLLTARLVTNTESSCSTAVLSHGIIDACAFLSTKHLHPDVRLSTTHVISRFFQTPMTIDEDLYVGMVNSGNIDEILHPFLQKITQLAQTDTICPCLSTPTTYSDSYLNGQDDGTEHIPGCLAYLVKNGQTGIENGQNGQNVQNNIQNGQNDDDNDTSSGDSGDENDDSYGADEKTWNSAGRMRSGGGKGGKEDIGWDLQAPPTKMVQIPLKMVQMVPYFIPLRLILHTNQPPIYKVILGITVAQTNAKMVKIKSKMVKMVKMVKIEPQPITIHF